jgi:hypothetical protein
MPSIACAADAVLKVGVFVPLSGAAASWGLGAKWVGEQAAAEINSNGGIKAGGKTYNVEVIAYENGYNSAEGGKAAQAMLNRDGVRFIIQGIGTEPVLAGKVGESADAGSHKRIALPLTKSRFPNSRAVGFFTRFQNAILGEVARLISLPSRSKSDQKSQGHQAKHPSPAAPGSEQEGAGAENEKDSQRSTGSEQSSATLGEDAYTKKHGRTVKQEEAWPEAHPPPDADGESESAGEVQKPGEMVGIVVKTPRPKGMALHPFRTKIRDPAEVWMRIGEQILKNTQSCLRKGSDQQDREECEPFPRARDDKNHQAINNPGC